jgi:hypothetical protein
MSKPKLLTASTMLAFIFIFAMTGLDVILSYMGWKPTFGDDLLAGIIGFLPSVGSVSLSMLIGVTPSWRAKILSGIIWLFCISISLSGNFLNMTARAFESLETENIAKVEVVNVENTNEEQIKIFKDANKEQLALYDLEIADLTSQYEKARESRDFQINDGVNRDGSIGPKARAFQASMDRISEDIENKRERKRKLQSESSTALLEFQKAQLSTLSKSKVELTETQNDMSGHMPVIRYFIPNSDTQRQVVLWGLGIFAAVISLAGPVVSYAMAVHLNHKRLAQKKNFNVVDKEGDISVNNYMKKKFWLTRLFSRFVKKREEPIVEEVLPVVEDVEEVLPVVEEVLPVVEDASDRSLIITKAEEITISQQTEEEQEAIRQAAEVKRIRRLKNMGYR